MKLASPAFENQQAIPLKYAFKTGNISPPLAIGDIPNNTKTLALIVDDPDAPSGHFTHWLVWNIPSSTSEIQEGILPEVAEQGCNDNGSNSWIGPAPPSGTHRYIFTAYALSNNLALKSGASHSELELAMVGYILTSAQLVGLFSAY